MDSWPEPERKRGRSSETIPKSARNLESKLLFATAHCVTQLSAQQRAISAWMQHIVLLPPDNHVALSMISAGKDYNAKRQDGIDVNAMGPAWVVCWRAMILQLGEVKDLLESEKSLLTAHVASMTSPAIVADCVRHCTAKLTHTQDKALIKLVVSPALEPLLFAILAIFRRQGAEIKHGSAPPLGPERTVQSLLKQCHET
jgi:hypothetical protein